MVEDVAIHEARHAVAAVVLRQALPERLTLTTEGSGSCLGRLRIYRPPPASSPPLWQEWPDSAAALRDHGVRAAAIALALLCHVWSVRGLVCDDLPRSVLEAMAMGRPIVTTDMPGCRETVIDGVNGFLVPPRDPAALAAALGRFVSEPELIARMGAASRRIAEAKYDVCKVNEVILDALEL